MFDSSQSQALLAIQGNQVKKDTLDTRVNLGHQVSQDMQVSLGQMDFQAQTEHLDHPGCQGSRAHKDLRGIKALPEKEEKRAFGGTLGLQVKKAEKEQRVSKEKVALPDPLGSSTELSAQVRYDEDERP
ncbi:UNVERIFIED_CONTAM: hypothetical protein K2H54_044399 [Gekko kuhli]